MNIIGTDNGNSARYSYSSATSMGLFARGRELLQLVRRARDSADLDVAATLATIRATKERINERTGIRVEGLKVLEIGPGQLLRHMRCFSVDNEVVGIDTDVIPQGRPIDYLNMLRHSPWMRSLKTIGRQVLGRDARFNATIQRALHLDRLE